jgi:hypothetical protein
MEENLIKEYYWRGHEYAAIVRFLMHYHGIGMSVRTLKRRLMSYGLCRRNQSSPLIDVWNAIEKELQGPG